MISPCVTPGQWTHPCICGADGLVVHRFCALSRLARGGDALHTGNQLPPEPPDVGTRRRLSLRDSILLPGDAAPRQPRRDPHRRLGVLSGDARRDSRRDAFGHHGAVYLPAGEDRRPVRRGTVGSGPPGRQRHDRRRRHRQPEPARPAGAALAQGRVPDRVVPTVPVVLPRPPQQPYAPGAAHRRWTRGVCGRGRDCRLVGDRPQAPAPLARYDGADRGAGRRRAAGRGRRELAGVLRRDLDRPGIFSRARRERRDDGVCGEELTVRPCHDLARRLSDADRRRRSRGPHQPRRTSCPTARCGARSSRSRPAASRSRSSSPGRRPISAGCAMPAAACGGACSRPASAFTNTAAR